MLTKEINSFSYHGLQAKHDLHVFYGSHQSGQKSVRVLQEAHHSLKVLHVPVLHDRIHLGRGNTQPP